MKKVIILMSIILISLQLFSQRRNNVKWVGVSAVGEFGNSILFNYAVENDENVTQSYVNKNYAYGGKIGVSFGDAVNLSVEALSHTFLQRYDIRPLSGGTYTKNLQFETTDIGLIFRYTTFAGVYWEVGPRFSTLKSADNSNSSPYETSSQIDSVYNNGTMTSITAGIGFVLYSSHNDRFRVNFGIRASYAFDDLMAEPNHTAVTDDLYRPMYEHTYDTQLFTITAKLELVFFPAYYGKAGCGKSRWVFFK